MYNFLLGLHSGLRYIVLLLLAIAIIMAITALFGKKEYSATNRKINLFTMIATHTQLLTGLILYFFSPLVQYGNMGEAMKNMITRYWTVEHAVLMLFAVALITVGHARSKKGDLAINKHRAIALYYGLAILVVVVAIYQSARPLLGMTVGN
jgi:uncharacterized membrane protein YozB (DUF420 family)